MLEKNSRRVEARGNDGNQLMSIFMNLIRLTGWLVAVEK